MEPDYSRLKGGSRGEFCRFVELFPETYKLLHEEGFDFYVHDSGIRVDPMSKRCAFIYAMPYHRDYPVPTAPPGFPEHVRYGFSKPFRRDFRPLIASSEPEKLIVIYYLNEFPVVCVDTLGNIHLGDIMHYEENSVLDEVLPDLIKEGLRYYAIMRTKIVNKILDFIKESGTVIREVVVKKEVDEDAIKAALEIAERKISMMYEAIFEAKRRILDAKIEQLDREIENARKVAVTELFSLVAKVNSYGWLLEIFDYGELYLHYPGTIEQDIIADYGTLYKIKGTTPFKIRDILIKLAPPDLIIETGYAKGYSPHRRTKKSNEYSPICLGTLVGKKLADVIDQLNDALRVIDIQSAYPNNAASKCEEMLNDEERVEKIGNEVYWEV